MKLSEIAYFTDNLRQMADSTEDGSSTKSLFLGTFGLFT